MNWGRVEETVSKEHASVDRKEEFLSEVIGQDQNWKEGINYLCSTTNKLGMFSA
jgi:hypothetical protein